MGGDAGEGADPDQAGLEAVETVHLGQKPLLLPADVAHKGEKPGPLAGEPGPVFAPLQQGNAPFLLQGADHPADAGLGIVKGLGGAGDAAQLRRLYKGKIFLKSEIHRAPFIHVYLCRLRIDRMINILFYQ